MVIDYVFTDAANIHVTPDDLELIQKVIDIALIHCGKRHPMLDGDDELDAISIVHIQAMEAMVSGMRELILDRWNEEQKRVYNLEVASSEAEKRSTV